MLYWLYYFQKNLICARMISIDFEYFAKSIDNDYFQPQMILGGSSKFDLNKKSLDEKDINKILAIKINDENKNAHLKYSMIFFAS